MKKICCVLLTLLLVFCCASALAEQCKYYYEDSPCEVKWWVDTQKQMHARACFNHVEEKEDMDSHVLVTDWENCTLDEGGQCTVCGWDYVREPEPDDYDEYWAMGYEYYYEWYGVPPLEITENNGKLTIAFKDDFFTFMDENGIPYTESAMVATEVTLAEVGGVLNVEVSEYGPGRWLMRAGMMSVEGPNGGVVEVTVEGKTYTLGSAAGVDLDHCQYYKEDSPCRPKWWVDKKNQQHARACFYHVEEKEDMSSHVLITPWEDCTLDAESVCTVCGYDYDPDLTQEDYDIMLLESFYAASNGGDDWQITASEDGNRLSVAFTDEVFALMDQFERPYTESSTQPSEITLERIGGAWQVTVSENGPAPWFQRMNMGWLEIGTIADEGDSASVEITVCGETYTLTAGGVDLEHCENYTPGGTPCETGYVGSLTDEKHAYVCFSHGATENDYVLITAWTACIVDEDNICIICGNDFGNFEEEEEAYELALVEAYYAYVDRMGIAPVHGVVSGDTLTVSLTVDFFALLDEIGIVYTEHLQAETLYTLVETNGTWQVQSSGYGPGLWLEEYELLGIDVTPLADGTATAYIAAELGEGYTLPEMVEPDPDCYHEAKCTAPNTCLKCGGEGLTLPEGRIQHGEAWFVSMGKTHRGLCEYCDKVLIEEPHTVWCGAQDHCTLCYEEITADMEVQLQHGSPDEGFVGFENAGDQCLYVCGCGEKFYYDHQVPCTGGTTCRRCYGEVDRSKAELDHDGIYGEINACDDKYHYYYCHSCKQGVPFDHQFEDQDACVVCGYEKPVLPAEYCKYYSPDSPCEPGWWLDRDNKRHARACFYHVEDKENMNSHVLITPWEDCTLDKDGVCTVCGHDYTPTQGPSDDLSQEECDAYMLEIYYRLLEKNGVPPMDVTLDGDTLTVKVNEQFQMMMLERGIPVTETLLAGTTYTLKQVDGAWTVEATEYGPGAWLARKGLIAIGDAVVSGGKAEAEIALDGGEGYVLTAGAAEEPEQDKDCYHRADCSAPTICTICGATGADIPAHRIDHDYSSRPVSQGDKHARVCGSCGQEYDKSVHTVYCDEPDVCCDCGGAVTAGMHVEKIHPTDTGYWFTNAGDQHYYDCYACGERWYTDHWVMCDNPHKCLQCDADNLNIELSHEWNSMFNVNSETHSFYCVRCKKDYTEPHEFDLNGCCDRCGYLREEQPVFPVLLPGDASGDGQTDIFDALAILQYAVGWDVEVNADAGDVDDNGKCDIFDALLILQYAVGWDVELK